MIPYKTFEVVVSHNGVEKPSYNRVRKTIESAQKYRDEINAEGNGWSAVIKEYEMVPVLQGEVK